MTNIPSREMPLSSFDPVPGTRSFPDYREVMAECDRLLIKIQKLKADWFAAHPMPTAAEAAVPSPS